MDTFARQLGFLKISQSFIQRLVIVFGRQFGHADSDALLLTAGGVERDRAYTAAHEA